MSFSTVYHVTSAELAGSLLGTQLKPDTPLTLDPEVLLETLRTNTVGPALLTQVCVPFLDKGRAKKIVNITSTLGSIASADAFGPGAVASYSMSKTALNMLVRAPDCVV